MKAKKKRPATTSSPSPGSKKKKKNPPAAASTNKSSIQSGIDLDALVGMTLFDKNAFHRNHRNLHRHTQPYLDHAYNIVLDFHKCDIRVLHEDKPDKKGAESDAKETKSNVPDWAFQGTKVGLSNSKVTASTSNELVSPENGEAASVDAAKKESVPEPQKKETEMGIPNLEQKTLPSNEIATPEKGAAHLGDEEKKVKSPEPSKQKTKVGTPNSQKTDTLSDQMVIGFPPTTNEMAYVEQDCIEYIHDGGPLDIGCDFAAVDDLFLSNLTRSSFQYTDYFSLIHDFKEFFTVWLTLDMLQFYHCWISRSIGSYPRNIFLLPLDYYQADIEGIFEAYHDPTKPVIKETFVKRMWRYVHPASHQRHKINMWKKKTGSSHPPFKDAPAAPWEFDIFKPKIICFAAKNIAHYGVFAALNAGILIHGDKMWSCLI